MLPEVEGKIGTDEAYPCQSSSLHIDPENHKNHNIYVT